MSASKYFLDSHDTASTYKIDVLTISNYEIQQNEAFITIPQFLNSEPDMCPLTFSLSSSAVSLVGYTGDITLTRTATGDLKFRIPLPDADKLSNDTYSFYVHAVNRDNAKALSGLIIINKQPFCNSKIEASLAAIETNTGTLNYVPPKTFHS
jgi:hypothetical protein